MRRITRTTLLTFPKQTPGFKSTTAFIPSHCHQPKMTVLCQYHPHFRDGPIMLREGKGSFKDDTDRK